ncbi:glycosyl hydrolase family 28-related protein [Dactylosporangium sp. CA-139066]|uniref:glycosyl hydrolase family 28-related protein n=1 Tax=Dactylosporangium sp. CA-139066 TaxID=3239930 RepID=UPI003D8FB5CD
MTTRRLLLIFLSVVALVAPGTVAYAAPGPVMYPRGVGADLGPAPVTLGLSVRPDAGLRTGTLDGKGYWQTTSIGLTADAGYADSVSGAPVVVVVTYHDDGAGALTLRTPAGAATTVAELAGTGAWRLAAVGLAGADLRGELRLSGDGDITVAQVRITASGPQAILGPTASDTGLSPRAGDNEAGLVTGTAAGRGFWRTNAAAPAPGTNYLYFNVADAYAYDTRDIVLVSVDYLDAGNGTLFLHYDSPGEDLPYRFKPSAAVTYGDTGQWRTHDFVLDDAVLTNRTNGADFRLTHDGSPAELTIAAVRVTVVPRQLDAKAGLRDLVAAAGLALYGAREGGREGQYPPGSKATLAAAIGRAQAVLDDAAATEDRVGAALRDLYDVLGAFRAAAVNTDLARAARLSASGTAAGSSPGNANDGDPGTVWTGAGTGEWLQADLGAARPVNEVFVQWGSAYSPDYRVELSADGVTYTQAGRNGGQAVRTRFAETNARYVRVSVAGHAAGLDHADIASLEIRDRRTVTPSPRLVETRYPTEDAVVADFDATAYGADRTGRRDATAALQSALWDCYDAGGGTVWLAEGSYRVTGTVEVPAFCTLRGDRRDPDTGGGSYGTVISADLPSGDDGPVLFRIGGSAGVVGLTTYYPRQSATAPVPYNFTFEIPGSAWGSDENYMMSTVADVTMLNSYRGIGISTMRDERGRPPGNGQTHESATVRNVRGTALYEGVEAYNGADVGTWEDIRFSNAYWAQAPAAYQPPKRSTVDAWTRANGTGFVLGDLEWDQFAGLAAADYRIGIHVVAGQRAEFTGVFDRVRIERTGVALQVDKFDERWGLALAASELQGDDAAVANNGGGYVKLTGVRVSGAVRGTVYQMDGAVPGDDASRTATRPGRRALYAPDAPHGNGYLPAADATPAIQRALDRAGRDGGGVVYLPAGWYRLAGRLSVPAGVQLLGASPLPNRDEDGRSGGTVLMAYAGRASATADTDPAAITLRGDRAGVAGLRVFYPENNPAAQGGLVPYPYTVRGLGDGNYAVNLGLPNAWNALDMAGDRFLVRKIKGTFVRHGVTARGADGRIEGVLSNGNTFVRTGFAIPNWVLGANLFPQVIDAWTRTNADLVTVDGARRLSVHGVFGYGLHNGIVVRSGDVRAVNVGTDNLGGDGFTVRVEGGRAVVANLMRYNGATSTGPVTLYNTMVINVVEHAVAVAAVPEGAGTVRLSGNASRPGYYEPGTPVTAVARPARGYRFAGWSGGGAVVSTAPTYAFTVTGPLTLTATFVAEAT